MNPQQEECDVAIKESKEVFEAVAFLCRLNKEQCQDLFDQLANAFLMECNKYPKAIVEAYNHITNWQGASKQPWIKINDSVAFVTSENKDNNTSASNNKVVGSEAERVVFFLYAEGTTSSLIALRSQKTRTKEQPTQPQKGTMMNK